MSSQENYFDSVSQQNKNNYPSFRVCASKNKNIDHGGKETFALFGLPIQNKNIAIIVFFFNS